MNRYWLFFIATAGFILVSAYNACSPIGSAVGDGSFSSGLNPGSGGSSGLPQINPGEVFFKGELSTNLRTANQCLTCHGSPREVIDLGGTQGPLIFESYGQMRTLLLDGDSATNNAFYNIVRGITPHFGGDRCAIGGVAGTPCKEIIEWYGLESANNSAVPGALTAITGNGIAKGWAADLADSSATISVNLYADGPKGQGTFIGTVVANQPGPSGGVPGNHAFSFNLPSSLNNELPHDYYAYGVDGNGNEVLLSGSPIQAVTYELSAAGLAFYNNNVNSMLQNNCAGCHFYDVNEAFSRILSPTPFAGGTAGNNLLITYATGGNGHAGGNACGGNCQVLRDWWEMEFGN